MYECEECHQESDHSKYHVPIIIESAGRRKMMHVECCSKENLLNQLRQKAESEKMFFDDVLSLADNFNTENLKKFEHKYGTYDEIRDQIEIDRLTEILAIVDQLKNQ